MARGDVQGGGFENTAVVGVFGFELVVERAGFVRNWYELTNFSEMYLFSFEVRELGKMQCNLRLRCPPTTRLVNTEYAAEHCFSKRER